MRTTKRARREARRLFRLCVVDGRLDERRALIVVTLLGEARRRGTLGILAHFRRLVALDRHLHKAVVESAAPLPAELGASVEAGVLQQYGAGIDVSFVENVTLIGGMRVRVASDLYDGSVRGALEKLAGRFPGV